MSRLKLWIKFLRISIVFLIIFAWIFSGWPQLGNFPPKIQEAQAAVAFQAASAIAASTGVDVTVTLPTHETNDIFLLQVVVRDTDDTITVTDWTQITTITDGTAAKHWWFWKRATGSSETNPLVDKSTATGDTYASVTSYRGAATTGDPWEAKGTATCTGTADPFTLPGVTTLTAGALVVATWNDIDNFLSSATYSATDPSTLTSNMMNQSSTGNDGTNASGSAVRTGAGATGNVSVTPSKAPDAACGLVLALKPLVKDSDGNLTACSTITEPVAISSVADTEGERVGVFDFTISDGGTSDGLALTVSQIILNTSGTGTFSDLTWQLYGPDANYVTGSVAAGTITFSGLSISIANAASEDYTIYAYFSTSPTSTDGQTFILSVDGDTDLTVGGSGTQMGTTSAVNNSTGSTMNVVHTKIIFSTQPPSSATTNTDFTGTIGVSATDVNNNVDKDFTENITLSAVKDSDKTPGSGTLSSTDAGGLTKTPTNGTATWTDTKYSVAEVIDIKAVSATTYTTGIYSTAVTVSSISLVQQKDARDTYGTPGTSGITVTLDSAATAGNLLVTGVAIDKASGAITVPSGFTLVHKGEGGISSGAMAFKIAEGGETSIFWDWTATEEGNAWVGEYSGLASSNVLDVSAENETYLSTATASISTGTTATTTQADELAIAMFIADSGNSVGTARSWTNGFTTLFEEPVPEESGNPFLNVATKTLTATGTVESTLSHNGSDECYAVIATFKAAAAGTAATISSAANQTFVVNQSATAISTITITDASTSTITATNDIRIKIPSTFNMTWDETGTIATIGGGAASKVSTTVSYEDSNKTLVVNVTTDFAASDSITISGLSFKNFTAASAADNLELETDNAGTTADTDDKTITIVAPTISSAASQTLTVGDSATAISTITITDAATPTITATNDIYVIIPATFNMTWDTSDTAATIGGTASSKVSSTVTYVDHLGNSNSRKLKIDVTTNFAASDTLTISDLSFTNFTATSSADNLELDTNADGTADAYDDKTKTIVEVGTATILFHCDNRPGNATDGMAQLTADFNQADNQMESGWVLTAVQNAGDIDPVTSAGGAQNEDGAYNDSELKTVYDLPHFFTVGNHEAETAQDMTDIRAKYSGYPAWNLQAGPEGCPTTTYSYDAGDIHVAVINEYWDGATDDAYFIYGAGNGGYIHNNLFTWLRDNLRASTKPYKIVVGHEPGYPLDRHVGDSLDQDANNRNKFFNLLKTERVIAYMSGHDHNYHIPEYDGVFEADFGVTGCMIGGGGVGENDNFATLGYAHSDSSGFKIRMVREDPSAGWSSPWVASVERSDLRTQVLVNTAEGAGTYWDGVDTSRKTKYFIDYTVTDQDLNPDWSGNNSSKWWESAFNDTTASWTIGEPSIGYDETTPASWINTSISKLNGVYGVFQRVRFKVYDKSKYNTLRLGVDYDDAITVWLNGTEIYKSAESPTVGADDIWDKTASALHAAAGEGGLNPSFTWIDVSQYKSYLNEGDNLLSIGNWNQIASSDDLMGGVKLILEDTIFVMDTANNRLMKRNQGDLAYKAKIGTLGTGDDQFSAPYGITSDNNYLWVADTTNNRIVKRQKNDNLTYSSQFTQFGSDTVFNAPRDIAVDNSYIYVADTTNHRLVRGNKSTLAYVDQFGVTGTSGADNTHLSSPAGVYVDDTYVYVSDSSNHRVVKLNKSNLSYVTQAGTTGTLGSGDNTFNKPYGITGDDTYIYFSDEQNSRICKRLKSDLSYVAKFGSVGTGDDQFNLTKNMDSDDTYLYVCDGSNHRIKKHFKSDLSYVSKIGGTASGTGDDQFNTPRGMTVDHFTIAASTAIEIRAQDYATTVSTITFPEGVPGATVSAPYNNVNGSGSPQTFGGAGTAKPVVTLYNGGASTLIIWYNITTFTNGIVSSEYYLINNSGAACADETVISNLATLDADTVSAGSTTIAAAATKDFYLKTILSSVAGKTGTSTLTILGEAP